MKYVANPIEVDAYVIQSVHLSNGSGTPVQVEGQTGFLIATPEMTARMKPFPGDYWVVQADGYVYLNPKDVFERKYKVVEPEFATRERA